MECKKCKAFVLKISELFFFTKSEKDVHLAIKPELLELVLKEQTFDIDYEPSKKRKDIKCKQCKESLGSVWPYGPNGKDFHAFGYKNILLSGQPPRTKWWKVYRNYSEIETRDCSTFFHTFNIKEVEVKKNIEAIESVMILPETDNREHFEWYTVNRNQYEPRDYQVEAYVQALQGNLIAVIKTGAGKTLIASMFLAKMCRLNPEKMGLFIVDRVPLGFQQGEALRKDTGLKILSLSGENKTHEKIKALNKNRYDILVITAGAFYDLVEVKNKLDKRLFCAVVLDECHHVTRGHRYVDVLKLFTSLPKHFCPRILGLTASPVKCKDYKEAVIAVDEFLTKFPTDTRIYYPTLENSAQTIEEEYIRVTEAQEKFANECKEAFKQICEEISTQFDEELSKDICQTDFAKAVGELRCLERNTRNNNELSRRIKDAQRLLQALEICNIMGVPYGCKQLMGSADDDSRLQQLTDHFKENHELSPRILKLQETLSASDIMNTKMSALVFVSRRDLVNKLTNHLKKQFKHLKVERVVGHSGHDGMEYEGGQKNVIDRFKAGTCNVLVCTSVLEEGIDVAQCDLVIYFTEVKNLIKFIQAKGRARKENGSRFIVYQNEGEKKKKRDLQKEEEILKKALERKKESVRYTVDITTDEIINNIKKLMNGGDDATTKQSGQKNRIIPMGESDFSFMIYIDQISDDDKVTVRISDIKEKLVDLLEQIEEFKLNRLDRIDDRDDTDMHVLATNAFNHNTLRFLAGVKCMDCNNPLERYKHFCEIFSYSFKIKGCDFNMWTKLKNDNMLIAVENDDEIVYDLQSKGFELGYFCNKISYVVGHAVEYDTSVSMKGTDILLRYTNDAEDREEQIFIPKSSIGNFVILSNDANDKDIFKVAFYLTHCPTIEKPAKERLTVKENPEIGNAFAEYPLILLNFENQSFNEILVMLDETMPVPYFNANLEEVKQETEEEMDFDDDMYEIRWHLKCLEDSRRIQYSPNIPHIISKMIHEQQDKKEIMERVVNFSCLQSSKFYFCGFEKLLSRDYNAFKDMPLNDIPKEEIPPDHFLIKRAVVTPLSIKALPSVPITSNRYLRKLAEKYNMIVVSFKDEDGSKVLCQDVHSRVEDCLKYGITINGKHFNYLAATSSQQREHKCYYIEATPDVIGMIRTDVVPNPEIFKGNFAKYSSRLGIYGTADKCVCQLEDDNVNKIDDVKSNDDRQLVTDGAGKISVSFAKEITAKFGLLEEDTPSAFQIRYTGIKGILVTTPDDDPQLGGKKIAVRPSMEKFENDDRDFCITSLSKINEFTLNREIISLLDAIPEKRDELHKTLMEYQDHALDKYSEMFINLTKTHEELKTYLPTDYVNDLISCSMELLEEKFWLSILQGIYRLRTSEIRTKTSIPVQESALLVGIPDPFGVLAEGEVFVQLKKSTGNKKETIERDSVLIFRNPCLHPGDVQIVTAVYKEELKDLYNVVVFPTKDCKQSLAVSCSGGDLDGDQYAVIWDKKLIPDKQKQFPSCDYGSLDKKDNTEAPSSPPPDVTDKEVLAKFYTKFMSNDCLGRVAHYHLALCDILEKGARDPLACELAKAQAQAVDFPKTGVTPKIPEDVKENVKSYPDFMEKPLSETYYSEKILGEMYRRCRSITYDFGGDRLFGMPNILINRALIVQGHEDYLKEAEKEYLKYAKDMDMIMKKFELKVEADIILGQATMKWSTHLEADKGKAGKAIDACYKNIIRKYRDIFFADVKAGKSTFEKASAWYRIVNDTTVKTQKMKKDQKLFRSFPWVVADVLCSIRRKNNAEPISRMMINLGESALLHFQKNLQQHVKNINEKIDKQKDVEYAVEKFFKDTYELSDGFIVSMYGSTSIYVSESDSDIDICILPKPSVLESKVFPEERRQEFKELEPVAIQRYLIENVISNIIDKIASKKRKIPKEIINAKVPIIKCSFEKGDQELECDISMNEIGLRKTLYIHYLYNSEPWYLPLFWMLVRWARIAGIIKSEFNPEKKIDTAEFYALIIHVLNLPKMEEMELKKPSSNTSIEVLSSQTEHFTVEQYHELGRKILDFFRIASTLKGNIEIKWPAPGIEQAVIIDDSFVSIISSLALKALHALYATRDVNTMLEYFLTSSNDETEIVKKLPLNVSYAIGRARAFHSARLSEVTGADVKIDIKEGTCNLVLTGKGTRLAIENLKTEIRSLLESKKALVLGRLSNKGSRYFMVDSSIIIVRNNAEPDANLYFEDSFSSYELHHELCKRSSVLMKHNTAEEDNLSRNSWKEEEFKRLYNKISEQLQRFPTTDNDELIESLEITIRFGTFYLVNIEDSLPDAKVYIPMNELQESVEKGRRSRKEWTTGEFRANYEDYEEYCTENEQTQEADEEPDFKFVELPSSKGGRRELKEMIQNDLYKSKQTRRGIAAAFSPGLLKDNTSDHTPRMMLQESFKKVLQKLHFKPGQSTKREVSPAWKVSVNPSSSYNVQVNFDEQLNVIKVSERPLNWIHGTILDGKKEEFNEKIRTNADIRLLISTQDAVKKGSDLYQSVLPEGIPLFQLKDGKPVVDDNNNKNKSTQRDAKDFIGMIRNVKKTEIYTNDSGIDACIAMGDVYFGDKMANTKPLCELSLLFDSETVVRAIRGNFGDDSLKEFVTNLFELSLNIKEELDKTLKEAGSKDWQRN